MNFLLLLACVDEQIKMLTEPSAEGEVLTDNDGDGFLSDEDCDDSDAQINPGAEELCDGFDNNCNNLADEESLNVFSLTQVPFPTAAPLTRATTTPL